MARYRISGLPHTWCVVAVGVTFFSITGCNRPSPENTAAPAYGGQVGNGAQRGANQPTNTGNPVPAEDYPWQVALQIDKGDRVGQCGGTLISPTYIITAAHCVDRNRGSPKDIVSADKIVVMHGQRMFGAGRILPLAGDAVTVHPFWKDDTHRSNSYDAALLRLASPITGVTVAKVRSMTASSGSAIVSGWGYFDSTNRVSPVLRAVALPVIGNDRCKAALPLNMQGLVDEATLCTESPTDDACVGDSGGPLVIGSRSGPQLIGVVSWGPKGDCTVRGNDGTLVGAFTRTSTIAAWVAQTTRDPSVLTDAAPGQLMSVRPNAPSKGADR